MINRRSILLAAAGMALATPAVAQAPAEACVGTLSATQILGCLRPPPKTRGFPKSRGIGVEGEAAPAEATVNLMINFDFNSAQLTNDGMIALEALGRALSDPSLNGARFLIAGHTDSVGSDAYNQKLSESRAHAVVDYLVGHFQLSAGSLQATGFGKTKPYDPNDPTAAVNRRVQVTRLTPPS